MADDKLFLAQYNCIPSGDEQGVAFNQSASKDESSKSSRIIKLILSLMYAQTPSMDKINSVLSHKIEATKRDNVVMNMALKP